MLAVKQRGTVAAVTPKNNLPDESYRNCPNKSSVERKAKIAERLGCPLYPYRPKSRVPQVAPESVSAEPELQNLRQGIPE